MRHLILLTLTALLAALLPPSLLSFKLCAALPHPTSMGITTTSRSSLSLAALSLAPHQITSVPLGGGLMSILNEYNGGFHAPDIAINVNDAPEGNVPARSEAFKLSVLGAGKGVDGGCGYSMVEFQNNHPKQDIIIYSAHIEPSVVFPLQVADSIAPNPLQSSPPPLFPESSKQNQQDRELHIQPGSTVTLPVSILPHYKRYDGPRITKPTTLRDYPHDYTNEIQESISAQRTEVSEFPNITPQSPPKILQEQMWKNLSLSSSLNHMASERFFHQDLNQMLELVHETLKHPQPKSLRHILPYGEIHETLLANTSWGFLRMKVPYACSVDSIEYEYGLPNNLMFIDGGGGWYARRNVTRETDHALKFGDKNPFVYELFIDNPSPHDLRVLDVFTTRPEWVAVRDRKREEKHTPYNPLVKVTIPPGQSNVYIASIHLLPNKFNYTDASLGADLGFLEIRTTAGDFSIGLDYIPNRHRWGSVHGLGRNHSTVGNLELVKTFKFDGLWRFLKQSREKVGNIPTSTINMYRRSDSNESLITDQMIDQLNGQNRVSILNHESFTENGPVLLTQPHHIDFGVITTGSRSMRVPLNLANVGHTLLSVMQISVTMSMTTDEGMVPLELDPHNLEVGVEFMGGPMVLLSPNASIHEFPHDLIFPPGGSYNYPVSVWCRFIVSPGHTVTPRDYSGSVAFRTKADGYPPYDDWAQETLMNDPLSPRFVTAVPFKVSVIPGNFRISTDSLLFPTHYTMLPPEELSTLKQRNKKKTPEYVDRFLEVTNNFIVPITVTNMEISNSREFSHCSSVFSIAPTDSSADDWKTAQSNATWRLPIRFTYSSDLDSIRLSKKCILTLETDRVGKQSLPLIIHSGELVAEVQDGERGTKSNECVITDTNGALTIADGVSCLSNWIETNVEGRAFRSLLGDIKKRQLVESGGSCHERTKKTLEEDYLESLLSNSNPRRMDPIMMKLGAVSSGSVVKRSIYLANMNPAPVEVTVSSAAFDGMNVTIGYKQISIPDALERGPRNSYRKSFLTHSSLARSFLSKFKYKVDISLSPRAAKSELPSLYEGQAIDYTFEESTQHQARDIYDTKKDDMSCTAGFMISTDGSYQKSFTTRGIGTKKWKIPPGGVARFVVTLRTPDRSELSSDMTSFIAAGLALETNSGQAYPIILSYSVILGELNLVPSSVTFHKSNETKSTDHQLSMQIPMTIRDASPPSDIQHGVPISLESTFSKEIFLGEIRSCNRWFDFKLKTKSSLESDSRDSFMPNYLPVKAVNKSLSDSTTLVSLGEVHSTISCLDESGTGSFFSCALKWLELRNTIQPSGCGLTDLDIFTARSSADRTEPEKSMAHLKTEATNALIQAVGYFRRQQPVGYILPSDLNIIQKAIDAWNAISSHGLNVVTGHLSAYGAYHKREGHEKETNSTESNVLTEIMNNHSNILAVPVSSILLKSTLDPPHFFSGGLEFDPVHVAQTSSRYIHVSNPTGVSVSVQLSAVASSRDMENDLFVGRREFMQRTVTDRHPWWTGESFWMSGKDGKMIVAPHNVTFESAGGSSVNLVQPSLQNISPFLHGCGTRCGRRSDADNAEDDVLYSTIGAGSGSGSTLLGHPWHVSGRPPQPAGKFNIMDPQPFAVGHSGLQEVVLPPYGKAELGPVYFRPTKRGDFNSSIFISNNLTGFEEVKLHGRGTWEKLAFLDNDDESHGGDIESRNGRSALVFSGSAVSNTEPVVKSFVVANLGDIAVNISTVSMRSSEIKHFSHRNAQPTMPYQSNGLWSLIYSRLFDQGSSKCSHGRFHIVGCEDAKSGTKLQSSPWMSTLKSIFQAPNVEPESISTTNSTSFQEGFTLRPNENRTFFIEHWPDCVQRTSYVSVVFEISGRDATTGSDQWHNTFRRDKLELLVGYNMNPYAYCIPFVPPISKLVEKAFSFAISSNFLNIASLGFFRRKDDQGNYPRYEVEVSYVAALFFALVVLLIYDIYSSLEFTTVDDHQSSSWLQTCRCLARADPVSTDLVALGKEQTKHVLLSRFRKEKVMPTNCVLPDGSFYRDKPGGEAGANSAQYRRTPSTNQQAKTFSDAVFQRCNLIANESKFEDPVKTTATSSGLLPSGIAWRTAARRGISISRSCSTSSAEPQHLARTRSVLMKKPKQAAQQNTSRTSIPLQVCTDINRVDNVKPPQDQQSVASHAIAPTFAATKLAGNGSTSKSSTQTKVVHEAQSKVTTKITTNKAVPVRKSHEVKEASPTIDKSSQHLDQMTKRKEAAVVVAHGKNGRNRTEKSRPVEKADVDKAKSVKPMQPPKREDRTTKTILNGKDKNSISRTSQSAPIAVKQPAKGNVAKSGSKKGDRETKQDSRKEKQPLTQAKSAESKVDTKVPLTKRSTSEESNPNSTPISSAQPSPRSEASAVTPKPIPLRPPPGLLPPPGFADPPPPGFVEPAPSERASPTQQSGDATPTLLSPQPSFSELSPTKTTNILPELQASTSPPFRLHHESIPSPSLAGLLSPRIEDDDPERSPNKEFVNSSMLITDLLPPPPSLTPPLLETAQSDVLDGAEETGVQDLLGSSNSSFNVMNFLDGIMNDAAKQAQPEESAQSNTAASTANPVSLDPWNSLTQAPPQSNPLAAIIGRISDVEATTLHSQNDQHEIAGIPLTSNTPSLLTPSALHSNISSMEPTYASLATEVEDEGEDDGFLEPDSFYSQLLGGE